jgi:VCBS repeat-containing protein
MTNKVTLLVLAVAALFALPAAASAQEVHLTGITTFTGSGGTSTLATTGEPTFACSKNTVSIGQFDTGSTTTGSLTLDFTGCSAEYFGIRVTCNTSGAVSGTIATGGSFHLITGEKRTVVEGKEVTDEFPAILVTLTSTTVICAGFSNTTYAGNVIGAITSPACGVSNKTITVSLKSTGATQEHTLYTGAPYSLTAKTGSGTVYPLGWNAGTVTLTSATAGTLECT